MIATSALRLLPDHRTNVLVSRRRDDCAHLAFCELQWIQANGCAQARCPTVCAEFKLDENAPRHGDVAPVEVDRASHGITCEACGAIIVQGPRGRTRRFCSAACKRRALNKRAKIRHALADDRAAPAARGTPTT